MAAKHCHINNLILCKENKGFYKALDPHPFKPLEHYSSNKTQDKIDFK